MSEIKCKLTKISHEGITNEYIDYSTYTRLTNERELKFWRGFCGGTCRAYRTPNPWGDVSRIVRRDPSGRKYIDIFTFERD